MFNVSRCGDFEDAVDAVEADAVAGVDANAQRVSVAAARTSRSSSTPALSVPRRWKRIRCGVRVQALSGQPRPSAVSPAR